MQGMTPLRLGFILTTNLLRGSDMRLIGTVASFALLAVLAGCATSNHGSYIPVSYVSPGVSAEVSDSGRVVGESRQTWALYVFPMDEAPSTTDAIDDAKSQVEGTQFLADMAIDDRWIWRIGYSVQVIRVEASAYK